MSLDVETHAHNHGHKTGHNWVDMVVAFSALFVSVVSLGVAIVHGKTMENMAEANAKLVSANSWPFLTASMGTNIGDGVDEIHMRVVNTGVGPAKIESAELIWKGVAYRTDRDFLIACCKVDQPIDTYDSDLVTNEVLRAGERIGFLEFKQSVNPTLFDALHRAMYSPDLKLVVCYCSIFDECWKDDISRLGLTPPRVKACEQPKVPFDEGLNLSDRKS
ncbi:MAG TPA: hypothetical protein VGM25_07705 [Caulobacteraceae bacterium]|jgi:hypothetical protein